MLAPSRRRDTSRRDFSIHRALCAALGTALALLIVALGSHAAAEPLAESTAEFSHAQWTVLLQQCVRSTTDGKSTVADYDCFSSRRRSLRQYLNDLEAVGTGEFADWTRDARLAFLINAYNAWTVELILTGWPDLESIKDLGSFLRSPWKKEFISLLDETRSLDDIEHGMIRERGRFDEPRIHFAVNCASIGCPALRAEAYAADRLEAQLEAQTRQFLSDSSRNRKTEDGVAVSPLFKWYREDFERGWRGAESLGEFLARYDEALDLDPAAAQRLSSGGADIDYLDYDWRLNAAR